MCVVCVRVVVWVPPFVFRFLVFVLLLLLFVFLVVYSRFVDVCMCRVACVACCWRVVISVMFSCCSLLYYSVCLCLFVFVVPPVCFVVVEGESDMYVVRVVGGVRCV